MLRIVVTALALAAVFAVTNPAQAVARPEESPEPLPALSLVKLQSDSLELTLSGGVPVALRNRLTGGELICLVPPGADAAPLTTEIFGEDAPRNLADAEVSARREGGQWIWAYRFADGSECTFAWRAEDSGDIVLRVSGRAAEPVEQIRWDLLRGCDLAEHRLVWITNFSVAKTVEAPFEGQTGFVEGVGGYWELHHYVHPLLALFEGERGGVVAEGRFAELSPAGLSGAGRGETIDLTWRRGYAEPTREPQLFEIRLRGYEGDWRSAVNPYIRWMEDGLGMVPLAEKTPAWVREVRGQTYVQPWETVSYDERSGIEILEDVAGKIEPDETLLGKISDYRQRPKYGFDHFYPLYEPTGYAVQFLRRAKELGFHTAFHVNAFGVDIRLTELFERFRPGIRVVGTDEDGQPIYHGYAGTYTLNNAYGKVQFAWCSPAYKPFRDFLVEQLRPMFEAGAEVVYLDECHSPLGVREIDGVTSVQGVRLLQQQILDTYPGVAIMVEQPSLVGGRLASFALTSHDLGHPLSGYIFGQFMKISPWWAWYQARSPERVERFMRMGWILPGASDKPDWLAIVRTMQRWKLDPAPGLAAEQPGEEGERLFGFRGEGATAFYEKRGGTYGLAVYPAEGEATWLEVKTEEAK